MVNLGVRWLCVSGSRSLKKSLIFHTVLVFCLRCYGFAELLRMLMHLFYIKVKIVWKWMHMEYRYSGVSFLHVMVLWDCRVQHFYFGTELRSTRGKAACEMSHLPLSVVSWTDSLKPSMLFPNFGCCISEGSLFRLVVSRIHYRASSWENVSSGVSDQVRLKLACSATEAS